MRKLNQALVAICVVSVLCPALASQDALAMKRRLEEFGPGADVKLRLADGSKRRGLIGQTRVDGFELRLAQTAAVQDFEYAQVASIELTSRVYRSNAGRDPVAAHRVALALGPGHHVLTRVRVGKTYRGHIDSVDPEGFTVLLDHTKKSITIPYAEIDHLEQNLSRAAKIGIVAAIAGGVALLVFWRYVIDLDE